jgi:hypothetical protein
VEAFPWEPAPGYLLRDRDAVYGVVFSRRAQALARFMREPVCEPAFCLLCTAFAAS